MRIGALKLGGLGDACDFAVILYGIRKQFPKASVTAISNGNAYILKNYADGVIVDKQTDWWELARMHGWRYDLFYDLRPHNGIVFEGDIYTCTKRLIANNRMGHKHPAVNSTVDYTHIKRFNHYNSLETNKLQLEHKSVIDLNCEAIGVKSHYDDARLPVPTSCGGEIITINTGAMGAERGRKQTKQWDGWQDVVDELIACGTKVIQLGIRWEKKLKRVEHFWQKPLPEVMSLVASSKVHLGNENGIIRLRRLVTDKPSVVVFGPTHPTMYGFENNINIWKNVCHPCFWYTGNWMTKCAVNLDCQCLKSIEPDEVTGVVRDYL